MTLPRFDARDFAAATPDMIAAFARDGVLVLENYASAAECNAMKAQMAEITTGFDPDAHRTVFSATADEPSRDRYFLDSATDIRFFFEAGALDAQGNLTRPLNVAINKVGHALHTLDPVFSAFSNSEKMMGLAKALGHAQPDPVQSMYIFKQPEIGGEVVCHQDATYLWTEPQSVLGFWLAVEDATEENGCMWAIPGAHVGDAPKERFRRTGDTGTYTETLDATPFEEEKKVPLAVPKGTLIVLHGLLPHLSGPNLSPRSRHAYTVHVVDGAAHYPADNWLQRA